MVCAAQCPGSLDTAVAFILRMSLVLLLHRFQKKPDLSSVFLLLPPLLPAFPQNPSELCVNQIAFWF